MNLNKEGTCPHPESGPSLGTQPEAQGASKGGRRGTVSCHLQRQVPGSRHGVRDHSRPRPPPGDPPWSLQGTGVVGRKNSGSVTGLPPPSLPARTSSREEWVELRQHCLQSGAGPGVVRSWLVRTVTQGSGTQSECGRTGEGGWRGSRGPCRSQDTQGRWVFHSHKRPPLP